MRDTKLSVNAVEQLLQLNEIKSEKGEFTNTLGNKINYWVANNFKRNGNRDNIRDK